MRFLVLALSVCAVAHAEWPACKKQISASQYQMIPHTITTYGENIHRDICGAVSEQGVSAQEKKLIVDKHNELRRKLANGQTKMPPASNLMEFEWDDELARIAQAWANHCVFEHDKCRATRDGCHNWVGQNLAVYWSDWTGPAPPDAKDWVENAIQPWWDEIIDYPASGAEVLQEVHGTHYRNGRPEKIQVGHFTAMAWAETHRVGCGYTKFNENQSNHLKYLYVCNYAKGGNIQRGEMYKIGNACSNCPKNSRCQNSLCKLN